MKSNVNLVDNIIQNRFVSHLFFWSAFVLFSTILTTLNSGSFVNNLINYLSLLPVQMIAAYTMIYYQVPLIISKRKYFYFSISFLLSAYIFSALARLVVIYIAEPFIRVNFEQEPFLEVVSDVYYLFAVYFPVVYVIVFLMLAMKTIKERLEEKAHIQLLQKEKATNELKFLKAQIHPHFLFNTLNNLYALTLAKSDVAPKVVVKLSEMLDYILYQCNEPSIEIEKEINLLQGYIDLEMLRYNEHFEMTFDHEIISPNARIAPLILLSIVDNAFKHGTSGNPIDPKIHIRLSVEDGQLYFKVFNTKSALQNDKSNNNGIGNTNLRRQLEINYPNKYQLEVEDMPKTYQVILKIDLN